jgi:hypothetical protein
MSRAPAEDLLVLFFHFPGPFEGVEGFFLTGGLGIGDELRVHGDNFVIFACNAGFQILLGGADAAQDAEMIVGMNRLGRGNGAKEPGDLGKAILLSLFGKRQVTAVGL